METCDVGRDLEQALALPEHDESSILSDDNKVEGTESDTSKVDSVHNLASSETRAVNLLRLVVHLVLLVVGACVAVVIYKLTTDQEQRDFVSAFASYATTVMESVQVNTARQLTAVDNFSASATAIAKDTNQNWPMVTIPSWSLLARSTLSEVAAMSILVHPIVQESERPTWGRYGQEHIAEWKDVDLALQMKGFYNQNLDPPPEENKNRRVLQGEQQVEHDVVDLSSGFASDIYYTEILPNGTTVYVPSPPRDTGDFFVLWQNAPAVPAPFVYENYHSGGDPLIGNLTQRFAFDACRYEQTSVMGPSFNTEYAGPAGLSITDLLLTTWGRGEEAIGSDPLGQFFYPIHKDLDQTSEVVAVIQMFTHWRSLFLRILPPDAVGVVAVFENVCGPNNSQVFSYQINGRDALFMGLNDLHDIRYDHMAQSVSLTEFFNANKSPLYYGVPLSEDKGCQYTLTVYPSQELQDEFTSNKPLYYTLAVVAIFGFAALVFIAYDAAVEYRQRLVMRKALSSGAIVSSIFPKAIGERMMAEEEQANKLKKSKSIRGYRSNKFRIASFLNDQEDEDEKADDIIGAKPLADLFPDATVMFCDIQNFTAWSSTRDPEQVFMLLQCIYQAFDKIATRMGVFKVETVGDSYVAATGLPTAQPNHAILMVQFTQACLFKFREVMHILEVTLGPDTGDLCMRFGIHTGPVTAGVLRGNRARFQLFGDTVNTASRMESSGVASRIQISKATAEKLKEAGKESWFEPRSDEVRLKGKGIVATYFINIVKETNSIISRVPDHAEATALAEGPHKSKKIMRLMAWNVNILADRLREVVARRNVVKGKNFTPKQQLRFEREDPGARTCLDEAEDVISMPLFDSKIAAKEVDPSKIKLGDEVMSQLHLFVKSVALMYRNNPFHNFEHASHVAMSVDKLLKRIKTPDLSVAEDEAASQKLHEYTHGITSDPLTQFGIVLSALIHDADHHGISNTQLAKENPALAEYYKNKSIAEQNSIDVAWDILMRPELTDLRNCIYTDQEELHRFRQTVISVVLATDIFDKELNNLRKQRWNAAFADKVVPPQLKQQDVNVKATIVIEHLIQASDVSHTMQHWHIYRKWNERLFCELYQAFKAGRMTADPSTFWYKGEIGFFDNYIIPLAGKLKTCNIFGVSSDEFLNYAKANREEWEQKGEAVVAELVKKYVSTGHEDDGDNSKEEVEYLC